MSAGEQQLRCYEELAPLTERMLALARSEHWAGLGPLEARFSALSEELSRLPSCGAQWHERCSQLHARIQANHDALRQIMVPELARLAAGLRSMEWQQSLQSAYSAPGRARL